MREEFDGLSAALIWTAIRGGDRSLAEGDVHAAKSQYLKAFEAWRASTERPVETEEHISGSLTKDRQNPHPAGVAKQDDKRQSAGQGLPEEEVQPEIDLRRESMGSPLKLAPEANVSWPELVARLPEKLRPHKEAMRRIFEETLRAGIGWRGTAEENSKAVERLKTEAAECGLRFSYSTSDAVIPVSLGYQKGVFRITADPKFPGVKESGYVTSTVEFPNLDTLPRKPRSKDV